MQPLVIEFVIKMFHVGFLWNILIINCITNSCILNTCITWQGADLILPEDDTIVSKHVEVW